MMKKEYLHTEDMDVGYRGKTLISHICLQVKGGQVVTLIGPNGSGKSTILKSIIRQLDLMGGTVYLDGTDMKCLTPRQSARKMAVLMTERVHPERMTCREVVSAGRYPYTGLMGILGREDQEKTDEALSMVGAMELASADFLELSDGQRQRILLARAICQEPELIVLDEPTSFLDIRYKLEILTIIKELVRKKQTAVLMSLHELDLVQRISDYVVCVNGSAVDRMGTPEEIFTSDYVRKLYGITAGSYCAELGFPEMEPAPGPPQVFVIGGNGTGLPVYRKLQRQGIPFAAGILHSNDVEYPVAKALAAEVIEERPFWPIREETFQKAAEVLAQCGKVICCIDSFGPMNEGNRRLAQLGKEK